jgi:hypothetical protein
VSQRIWKRDYFPLSYDAECFFHCLSALNSSLIYFMLFLWLQKHSPFRDMFADRCVCKKLS